MFFGPIAKELLVAVVVPLKRGGRTKALILSIIETHQYQILLDDLALPSEYGIAIFDSKGAAIARRPLSGFQHDPTHGGSGKKYNADSNVSRWSLVLEVPKQIYSRPLIFTASALAMAIILIVCTTYVGGLLVRQKVDTGFGIPD